jgi:hypothetical protein
MGENDNLSAKQRRFVAAMLAAPSLREACRQVGISESTGQRWTRAPALVSAMGEAQRAALVDAARRLTAGLASAIDTLVSVSADEHAPASARVGAARAILDATLKAAELAQTRELAAGQTVVINWDGSDA